jgi:hypothetical protein
VTDRLSLVSVIRQRRFKRNLQSLISNAKGGDKQMNGGVEAHIALRHGPFRKKVIFYSEPRQKNSGMINACLFKIYKF